MTCVNQCELNSSSQRSLHNAPIFRLLLKVAVNGTHQCDFLNFCGGFGPQRMMQYSGINSPSHKSHHQKSIALMEETHQCMQMPHMCQAEKTLPAYLLGLLAMIKCSICSYQCDNWYVSNWRLACHINFWLGRCPLELAQWPSRVALAWHLARRSTPFGVTKTHWTVILSGGNQSNNYA